MNGGGVGGEWAGSVDQKSRGPGARASAPLRERRRKVRWVPREFLWRGKGGPNINLCSVDSPFLSSGPISSK